MPPNILFLKKEKLYAKFLKSKEGGEKKLQLQTEQKI